MGKFKEDTLVRGVRATKEFWDNCEKVARESQKSRNQLIVEIVSKYLKQNLDTQKN